MHMCFQDGIGEVKKDMAEFSELIRSLPPVTSKLLTKEDVDRILAEDEGDNLEETLDIKLEPGMKSMSFVYNT